MKARVLLVVLVAALAADCTRGMRREPSADAPLAWRDCGSGFECAELHVPIDDEGSAGGSLALAVVRLPAADPSARLGVLVTNPGGPGLSAADHLRGRADGLSGPLRDRFDLIAFDTRGTGAGFALDCHESLDALFAVDPTPESDAEWEAALAAARAFAQECARKHADALPFMGTAENARDLERLRVALGEEQLSYLGFSYGTALGAVYASRYPERVRAFVLDAPVDPGFDLVTFAREQSQAVEGALAAYQIEAARKDWHGVEVLEQVAARAELAPIPSGDGERAARASDVLYGSVEAVVDSANGWRSLSRALGQAQTGDGAALVRLSDRYFGRAPGEPPALLVEAQLAVLCADLRRPPSLEAFRAALPELAQASPHFGVANYLSLLPCMFWPEPARPVDAIRAVDAGAILVVSGTRDPLTPHVWGERMAVALGAPRLDVESDVHTSYGRDEAAARRIDEFLLAPR